MNYNPLNITHGHFVFVIKSNTKCHRVILRDLKKTVGPLTNSTSSNTNKQNSKNGGGYRQNCAKGERENQSSNTFGNKTGKQPVSKPGE